MFCEYKRMIESRLLGREYREFLRNLNDKEIFDFSDSPKGFNVLKENTQKFIVHLENWRFNLAMYMFYKEGCENLIDFEEYINM